MQVSRLGLASTPYLDLYRPLEDPKCAGNGGSETARENTCRTHQADLLWLRIVEIWLLCSVDLRMSISIEDTRRSGPHGKRKIPYQSMDSLWLAKNKDIIEKACQSYCILAVISCVDTAGGTAIVSHMSKFTLLSLVCINIRNVSECWKLMHFPIWALYNTPYRLIMWKKTVNIVPQTRKQVPRIRHQYIVGEN